MYKEERWRVGTINTFDVSTLIPSETLPNDQVERRRLFAAARAPT